MQAVVSVVAVPPRVAATMLAVVLTTGPRVATSATSSPVLSNVPNPVLISAKKVSVLKHPVVVIALSNALHPLTPGTRATAVLPHVKTLAKMAHVKVAAGKSVALTTAMQPGQPHAALRVPVTSLHAAPSNLVPATSSHTLLQAKAPPSAVARAS
jgi:hypothetical protein